MEQTSDKNGRRIPVFVLPLNARSCTKNRLERALSSGILTRTFLSILSTSCCQSLSGEWVQCLIGYKLDPDVSKPIGR